MQRKIRKSILFLLVFTTAFVSFSVFAMENDKNVVISNVTIHPVEEVATETEDEAETSKVIEYNFGYLEDTSDWELFQWQVSRTYEYLWCRSSGNLTPGCRLPITNMGDDFVLETRVKIPTFGNCCGISFEMEERTFMVRIRPYDMFLSTAHGSYVSDEVDLSNPDIWYDLRIETYNRMERARVYLSGSCIADIETIEKKCERPLIQYFVSSASAEESCMYVDWMKFTPINYTDDLLVSGIKQNGEYPEGEEIQIATAADADLGISEVNYRLNGQVISTGKAPEYRVTLKNLPQGFYKLTAESGKHISPEISFSVTAKQPDIELKQLSDGLQVSLVGGEDISIVDYLLDGSHVVSSTKMPFGEQIIATPESHTVSALAYDDTGKLKYEIIKQWAPDLTSGQPSLNYANEISYSVSGSQGTSNIVFGNGNHLVHMLHSPDEITYQTANGEETYPFGLGQFTILTDGPFAEVYRNGQLVFAYLLPRSDVEECYARKNGLKVDDFSVVVPENRRNYFVKRNLTDQNTVYSINGVDSCNNLDFVADNEDVAEIALNDGYYTTKLSIEDEKIYAWTVLDEKSVPEKKEVGTVLAGNSYYRVEMTGGMIRFYVNGKWVSSFRGVLSTGTPQIGVNVIEGDLNYLAVSDCSDLYLYHDNFFGNGDFETLDYWRLTDVKAVVDTDAGTMTLDGIRKKNAIAELNVYAGNLDLSTMVELDRCKGGFWFIVGHSIQEEYTKIGYNAITGRFEVVDVMGTESESVESIRAEVEGKIPFNQKVDLELKIQDTETGKKAELIMDGNTVLMHEEENRKSQLIRRGKIGFLIEDCVAKLSEISYRGDGKPLLSVYENDAIPFNKSTFDLIENQDGIVLVGDDCYLSSKTGGKSWKVKSADPLQGCDVVQLANGEILSVKMMKEDDGTISFVSAISTDGGRSYSQVGIVKDSQGAVTTTGNRVCQGESGRVYFLGALPQTENKGAVVVYYSDDNGRNWMQGQTIDYEDMGCSVQEPKMLELENGHCRMWVRTDLGAIAYIDSYDYGVTWDEAPIMTPMFSSSNCFNVDQDLKQRNVLYIGWPYDNANLGGMIQYPRTRWAIAKSEDYGETWEFIGTTMEYSGDESSVQNMGINVTDEYVVQNANGIADSTNEYGGRYITLARNKQVETPRFEQLHLRYPTLVDGQAVVSPEQKKETIALNLESGTAVVGNRYVKDGAITCGILLDFDSGCFVPDGNFLIGNGMTYDSESGMTLNGGQLRYTPIDNYSPILSGERYVCFSAKLPDESSEMQILFQSPEGNGGRGSIKISADSFETVYLRTETENCGVGPGTEWVDYKLVADTKYTASLYMRSESLTNNKWVLAIQGTGYTFDNSPSTGLYFSGHGSVRNAIIYGDTGDSARISVETPGGAEVLAGVSVTDVAAMVGASVKVSDNENAYLCLANKESPFELIEQDRKKYIDLHSFVEYGALKLIGYDELILGGKFDSWSERSVRAFRLATNLLGAEYNE